MNDFNIGGYDMLQFGHILLLKRTKELGNKLKIS